MTKQLPDIHCFPALYSEMENYQGSHLLNGLKTYNIRTVPIILESKPIDLE